MWADRCTRPHCALCALNTNDISTSSSGYTTKPSYCTHFRVTNQMQIMARAYCVTESNSIGIKNVSRFVFIAVRPEVLQYCAVRADTVHSASTDPSYSCTGSV
jgi:hypothetical protein